MKFIRVNGRVVPIQDRYGGPEMAAAKAYAQAKDAQRKGQPTKTVLASAARGAKRGAIGGAALGVIGMGGVGIIAHHILRHELGVVKGAKTIAGTASLIATPIVAGAGALKYGVYGAAIGGAYGVGRKAIKALRGKKNDR